jgi:N-acetyl-anhydromuramyl-L-alanine amidase AmpD
VRKAQLARKPREAINHGPDNAILEQPVSPQPLEFEQIQERKQLVEVEERHFALVQNVTIGDDLAVERKNAPGERRKDLVVLAVPADFLERFTR